MSLRIKVPPKPHELDIVPDPLPSRLNSDEEDYYADSGYPGDSTQVHSGPESEEFANEPDSRFLHQSHLHPTPSSSVTRPKRVKRNATPDSALAKRKLAVSEQDTGDEYTIDDEAVIGEADVNVDGDFEAEHKRQSKRARTKTLAKPMKGKTAVGGPEFAVKEGRNTSPTKGTTESSEPHSTIGSKRSRAKPLRLEDAGDAASSPDLSVTRSPSPPRETSPPPAAKKRKLPTIKKNKTAVPGTSTSSAPNKPVTTAGLPKQGLPEAAKPVAVRKTPATAGNADFDLRNESVYRELFKPTGGSTPRSGLSRREKDEERRKELNKLRDEAKAKRSMDAKVSFDLQGQFEKILRFEERLRHNRSSALYPNFLAGKWRELWELERRHQREKEWQENPDEGTAGKEEGEMIDN
ncbi:hypothetical protein L208DRAFT_1387369 [Tricholoma matsutake]|nr:hypothetical protein L208DRAFT_1387369 [Tricholoma matsutake 945]